MKPVYQTNTPKMAIIMTLTETIKDFFRQPLKTPKLLTINLATKK